MARAFPERAAQIRFESAQAIREEIARAVPLYKGIEALGRKGDQFQWGGRTLYADGRFATPDGKAHFAAISSPPTPRPTAENAASAENTGSTESADSAVQFRVSTLRGKQFNSMIQRDVDPLTGAARDEIFISAEDLRRLDIADGAPVELRSPHGTLVG